MTTLQASSSLQSVLPRHSTQRPTLVSQKRPSLMQSFVEAHGVQKGVLAVQPNPSVRHDSAVRHGPEAPPLPAAPPPGCMPKRPAELAAPGLPAVLPPPPLGPPWPAPAPPPTWVLPAPSNPAAPDNGNKSKFSWPQPEAAASVQKAAASAMPRLENAGERLIAPQLTIVSRMIEWFAC